MENQEDRRHLCCAVPLYDIVAPLHNFRCRKLFSVTARNRGGMCTCTYSLSPEADYPSNQGYNCVGG